MRRSLSVACVLLVLTLGMVAGSTMDASADNITQAGDNARTSWDSAEPGLAPSTVTSTSFGQLFATKVQGQVYAQPLVIGSTVIAGTEDNYIYGLDAANGSIKWQRSLGAPWPASAIGCADLTPNLGETSTGVYDPSTGYVYLTTKVNDGADLNHPNWYLHAISPATGAERTGWPIKIAGTPANDPAHPFTPYDVNQRPGLLLVDGRVYLGFGSECDYGHYVGWIASVSTASGAMSMWSDEAGATSGEGGIWQAGGGLVSDGSGRVFVATGNGVTAPDGPGANPPQQISEAVVRLAVGADGTMTAKDFFSPSNAAQLDRNDQDLGSGGPVALPDSFGTAAVPHLIAQIGKDGRLFLLNRDNLGGKNQKAGGGDNVVQVLGPYKGVWGKPAVYGGEGGYLYVVQNSGSMLAFKAGVDGTGKPAMSLAGNSAESFAYTAGSPIVTSDGTTPGSGVVWVVNDDGTSGANGRLCAYNAVPANNHINLLRCFPIGTSTKFATPAASAGRVYIGTRDGYLYGFGQPTTAALQGTQTSFGDVLTGQSKTVTVTVTAARTVTVDSVDTTGAPFAVSSGGPALPVTLTAGQQIAVPVTFAPTAPGSITGALRFAVTEAGVAYSLGTGLQGNAVKPGLTATPGTLDFGQIPVGSAENLTVNFTNTGTTNETVSAVTTPASPFTATGLPAIGTVLQPGQSIASSVNYTPAAVATDTSTISVTSDSGTETVALTGQGVTGHAELSISPASLNFGAVPVGQSATQTITVTNSGNLPVTVTKAAPPTLPFVVGTPLAEGLVLNPGDDAEVDVTFAPTTAGSYSGEYLISSDDGAGAHVVEVHGTAAGVPGGTALAPLARGGWQFNGSAAVNGSDLDLTPATANQAGSAVWSTPLPSDGLTASFTAQISGGTGGDGMTFALLSAAGNTPKSLGGPGGGLGFAGLPGVAVTLDTYKNATGEPSNNFLGISTTSTTALPQYVATTTGIPALRTGTHAVSVTVTGTIITVYLDGAQRLAVNVPGLTPSVLPAFTAGNGGATDQHIARGITLTSGGTTLPQPGTGWRFNGSATMNGSQAVLTPATTYQAGSILYSAPVATDGLTSSFELSSTGGTGADGSAFVLLDPAGAAATSVGKNGGLLGFGGLPGVAVTFSTYPASKVGIETGTAGGTPKLIASTTTVPDLRAATRDVVVAVNGTTVTVSVDGVQVLQANVPGLQPTAITGFSAGNGSLTDVHSITGAQIVAGGHAATAAPTGWQLNGSAAMTGTSVRLTAATANQTGTAIYGTAVPTAALRASFTVTMNGGTGADGLTFMLLDPAKSTAKSLGTVGAGLGFGGLTGVALAFGTYPQGTLTTHNWAAVSAGGKFVATSTALPALRTGTHTVYVTATTGHLTVTIDGAALFNLDVPTLTATALAGFSGSTGGATDTHTIGAIHLAY